MQRYLDVLTIKSKSEAEQRCIISETVKLLADTSDLSELRHVAGEEIEHADQLPSAELITLWILVTYAADIGTVPLRESRDFHLSNLDRLSAAYGIPQKAIRRLSVHGDFGLKWFDEQLSRVEHSQ